ncbi:hypothetical protein [Tepidibacillus decaturensis]|nr:hypothetical protein [Tepidibacillus decaturensis]
MAIYTNGNLAYQTQQKSLPHQQRIRKVNKKAFLLRKNYSIY